ncbi:MAG TPA: tRNA pseudouridine(38-40) synthase TruA [bacterium]|nr:tRNA pseudouridine(38-40) synthase TruA [bacterium]
MTTRNIRLTLEYDGTHYSGWQKQPQAPTIQGVLEDRLSKISGHPVDLLVAGRTDAGVHALGQTANFHTASKLSVAKIKEVVNQLLPHDIRIVQASEVPATFHATYHALSKHYRYVIRNQGEHTVFDRHTHHHLRYKLDLAAMRKAVKYLLGTHDFTAFRGTLGKRANPKRTLTKINVSRKGSDVFLDYFGVSFLHQMIRILSGTLVYVGTGKFKPEDMKMILKSRDRKKAGPTLPPGGLFLVKVFYPKVFPPVKRRKKPGAEEE